MQRVALLRRPGRRGAALQRRDGDARPPVRPRRAPPELLRDVVVRDLREGRARGRRGALRPGRARARGVRRRCSCRCPTRCAPKQRVFEQTGGLHAAGLFTPAGELVSLREDVGRHNAVDKVIGEALLARPRPARRTVLQVSGRGRASRSSRRPPWPASPSCSAVSAPSSLAVEAGERFGMTLVGFVREGRCNVYTHPERVRLRASPRRRRRIDPRPTVERSRSMQNGLTRLTEPMVRDNGELRVATWDEALDRAAAGAARRHGAERRQRGRPVQLLEGHERDELRRTEVRPSGPAQQQHRLAATAPDTLLRVVGLATVFGAGGGTSSYEEVEHTDLMLLWGSNARAAHPIFFHHVLKGIHNGACGWSWWTRDGPSPREWADLWLGHRRGHRHRALEHHRAGDHRRTTSSITRSSSTPRRASTPTADSVMDWTLERGEAVTGVPADDDPGGRARLREGRPRHDLLDPRASPSTTTPSTTCSH